MKPWRPGGLLQPAEPRGYSGPWERTTKESRRFLVNLRSQNREEKWTWEAPARIGREDGVENR